MNKNYVDHTVERFKHKYFETLGKRKWNSLQKDLVRELEYIENKVLNSVNNILDETKHLCKTIGED